MSARVEILIEDESWKAHRGLARNIAHAAELALSRTKPGGKDGDIAVLLSTDACLRKLNARFRGKNKFTNVLAFPSARESTHLGDVAIAYGVTAEEARKANKTFADHAQHLAVHGILHLLGLEHETVRGARKMEALEVSLLQELGIDNPYAPRRNAP